MKHLLQRIWLGRSQAPSRIIGQVSERPVVAEPEARIVLQAEPVPYHGDDLGLLDRVNAQIGLKLVLHAQLGRRVAGGLGHDLHHSAHHKRGRVGRCSHLRLGSGSRLGPLVLEHSGRCEPRLRRREQVRHLLIGHRLDRKP